MAPGVNGSGKHTGTVPKSKTHNDGRRDSDNRRDTSINNIPNNLAPFDWQQIPDSSQNSSLKPSNTRTCDSDCYDFDGAASHDIDNRRRRLIPDEQGIHAAYLPVGYPPASVKPTPHPRQLRHNSHRLTCYPQQSLHTSQVNHSHVPSHMMMASDEEEGASSFDSFRFSEQQALSERNGSTQEWVDQGGSGEGRAIMNHASPSTSEQQIRGSKPRDGRDRNILPDRENKSNISKMPDRNQVLSRLNQIRDYINQTTSLMDRMQNSRDPRVAAEYSKLTKMLLGLRDSEKKLEDLLSTLKNLAECGEIDISGGCVLESVDYDHLQRFSQLLEVLKRQEDMYLHLCSRNWGKMKQENPDIRSSGRNLSREKDLNPQATNMTYHSGEMTVPQSEMVNTMPDFLSSPDVSPLARKGKLDHLKERIQALKELYENRNQLMELLGDEDEELSSEHHALQHKLEDLQQKKSQMDQLVQELKSLNCFMPEEDIMPEAPNEPQSNEAVQEMENGDVENEQPEHDIQEVLKNMEELKQMKERLAILQGMMTNASANQSQASGGDSMGNDNSVVGEKEEHAVNIRRQRDQRGKQQSSSKPDNISLSSEAGSISNSEARQLYISTRELERKTMKLQEAKHRLQQLEKLLDVVQENRKDGQALSSEQFSQLIHAVAEDDSASGNQNQRDDSKEQGLLMNVAEDQSLQPNSQQSNQRKYVSLPSEDGGSSHDNQRLQQFSRSRTSSAHGSEDVESRLRATSPLGPTTELSVEALQAMTQNLKEQAMTIRAERERLAAVKWQIGQRRGDNPASSPPPSSSASTSSASSIRRDKNRNTMGIDTQSCRQMLLQAELQAKRRELEELMRKDRGHQASINQDICSEISASKSETPGFSHVTVEGTTTNATWGGSTQGTLDDLAERDIEVQDQSGGYSSDEGGRNEEESKEGTNFQQATSLQDQRISQLNVSLAREQPNHRSQSSRREMLNISLESQGRPKTSINSNNSGSNTSSTLSNIHSSVQAVNRSTPGRSPVRTSQNQHLQQNPQHSTPARSHAPSSHNIWKKDTVESTCPRAVWTPSSAHARQENLCSADELVADSGAGSTSAAPATSFPSAPSSLHTQSQANPANVSQANSAWWQQQAQQLQNQLEATTSLCQSLMTEQQHHNSGPGCPFPGLGGGYNVAHPHPLGFATPPTASPWPFPNMASPWMLTPSPLFPGSDHSQSSLTLHSCASHQLQQQQVLLTLSQCCHLLWLQHRELASLQATVQGMQERVGRESRQDEEELSSMQMQHPQLQQQVNPHTLPYHNRVPTPSAQPYPVPIPVTQSSSSHSLSRRLQKPVQVPSMYQEVTREGLVAADVGAVHGAAGTAASGVASAHSLPNLCTPGTSMMGLPHLLPQASDAHPSPGATYLFPSEPLPPPPPLGATSYAHADHWALHPGAAAVARGPPVALNNQVPPGIRANNYWDNFRSYSRQNLLSTTSKSNEGFPHIPSPLVMRSHNFLRAASHGHPIPPSGLNATPVSVPQATRHPTPCQKEKLNTDQQSGTLLQHYANRTIPNPGSAGDGSQYGAVGFSSQDLTWESPQSSQPSQVKEEQVALHEDSNRRCSTRERGGLFEVLRESVYSEVATLIAQNENRPHYLIQLFRDLQMVSCDALRQRTLHTIHRIVSRYIQENGKESHNGQQTSASMDPEPCLPIARECDSSGEEEIQERSYRGVEEANSFSTQPIRQSEMDIKQTEIKSENQQLGHGIEEPSLESCSGGHENLNENVQSMLHQLLPLLKPHLNEPSSFMLLQNICLLAFQFLSSSINSDGNKAKENPLNTSLSFHQLNSLLEETCLRFEGCKLKDVGEELLTCIGEVLVKAIASSNQQESNKRKVHEDIEEGEEESLEVGEGIHERAEAAAAVEEERNEAEVERIHENCCDEDLAEADQSLGSAVGVCSELSETSRRFPISKEVKTELKEEVGTNSFPSEESFVADLETEKQEELAGRRDPTIKVKDESATSKTYSQSEECLECNGNNNDNTCCHADELGAEALVDSTNIPSDEVKNQAINKTEVVGWNGIRIVKEHRLDNTSSRLSSPSPPLPISYLPKVSTQASNSEVVQTQWNEDGGDVVTGAEADLNENSKGDTSGSI